MASEMRGAGYGKWPQGPAALLWTGAGPEKLARMLAAGALVWLAYSLLQVAVNGAVLDETVVPAQIIAGKVQYPAGHPHRVFYPSVLSLTNYLGAGQLRLLADPLALSAVRNVIFLFLSLYVPFLFALLLTGRPKWGHLAASVFLAESTMQMSGVYPMWVFPNFYSHGHIGLYAALLAAGLLLARRWRLGGLLLGLLPSLHAGLALLAWPWACGFLMLRRGELSPARRRQLLWGGAAGVAVCGVLFLLTLAYRVAQPFPAPYDGLLDGELIYESFTSLDVHRRIPWLPLAYVLNPAAFLALGLLLVHFPAAGQRGELTGKQREAGHWTVILGGLAWVMVLLGMLGQWMAGELPRVLQLIMPLRFSNATVVLLVPLLVALAAVAIERMPPGVGRAAELGLAAAIGLAGGLRLLEGGAIGALYPGRIAGSFLFAFMGVVIGCYLESCRRQAARLAAGAAVALAVLGGLVASWHFTRGAVFFLVALVGTWLMLACVRVFLSKVQPAERTGIAFNLLLVAACLVAAIGFLPGRDVDPWNRAVERWDTVKPFDIELERWLERHAAPNELILGPIYPRPEIQAKTGHPALMELETLYLMSYMPHLSSTIGTMALELYGVDLSQPGQLAKAGVPLAESPAWLRTWKERNLAEWRAVGQRYGFRLVLAPTDAGLNLPVVLSGPERSLYMIP